MNRVEPQFPGSPKSDEIDRIAIRSFYSKIPSNWSPTRPEEDKGCDREIEIIEDGANKGKRFKVQIKGTSRPSYISNRKYISHRLDVSTINYLISNTPGMLCVCAAKENTRPIYYMWLHEYIRDFEKIRPKWDIQKTITIRIPTSQLLNDDAFLPIEKYVKEYFDSKAIDSMIANHFVDHSFSRPTYYQPISLSIRNTFDNEILPRLQASNSGEVSDLCLSNHKVKYSDLNKSLIASIKESSAEIESFYDMKAIERLNILAKKINKAPNKIKAMYLNNLGVLDIHNNELSQAKRKLRNAIQLDPQNIKYKTNLLSVIIHQAVNSGNFQKNLPKRWLGDLEAILKKNENYRPAIIILADYQLQLGSFDKALSLVKSSILWKEIKLDSLIAFYTILHNKRKYQEILDTFALYENTAISRESLFWSLYGDACFAFSIPQATIFNKYEIVGPGPANVDLILMNKSESYYKKAWDILKDRGFPKISEQLVENYSVSLILQGKYVECENICSVFLNFHPNSIDIIENYVACMLFNNPENPPRKSLELLQQAYYIRPNSSKVYQNFILVLFIFEMFEDLIKIVTEKEENGFNNIEEEGLSRSLLSKSFNSIGNSSQYENQLSKLRDNPRTNIFYLLTRAELALKSETDYEPILEELKAHPNKSTNQHILENIVRLLSPITESNAQEIIDNVYSLNFLRELTPEEYSILGRAYLSLGNADKAISIYKKASDRYPYDNRFLYLCGIAYYESGNELLAYECLEKTLTLKSKDYSNLKNVAILARNIGNNDKAIALLERCLTKITEPNQRAEIHSILFGLKKICAKPIKEILKHAHEYGRLISRESIENEVRYLLMFIIGLINIKNIDDKEISSWIYEYQDRLRVFTKKYPDYPALRIFHIPSDIPNEKIGEYVLNQIAFYTLPHRLAIAPFELSARAMPWPIALRSRLFFGSNSIFDYWNYCIRSNEYSHSVHIWTSSNNIDLESKASNVKEVCIDLNALLTLAHFDLLDSFTALFDKIVLASGTIQTIENERTNPINPNPLAESIYQWKQRNLKYIRIHRNKNEEIYKVTAEYEETAAAINDKNKIVSIYGNGIGESILSAKCLGIALYSDDAFIRDLAINMYKIDTFCTISLLARFRAESKVSVSQESIVYSKMIRNNFNVIPFSAEHLFSALVILINERKDVNLSPVKNDDLKKHEILGPLIKRYEENSFNEDELANTAVEWWIEILDKTKNNRQSFLEECMKYISFCLGTQKTSTGILTGGIKRSESHGRSAKLWALFLFKNTRHNFQNNIYAWPAIRANCRELFKDEITQNIILYELIPYFVAMYIRRDPITTGNEKEKILIKMTDNLKYEADAGRLFESLMKYFVKLKK